MHHMMSGISGGDPNPPPRHEKGNSAGPGPAPRVAAEALVCCQIEQRPLILMQTFPLRYLALIVLPQHLHGMLDCVSCILTVMPC